MNTVYLGGTLPQASELIPASNGSTGLKFRIKVVETWVDKGGQESNKTQHFTCVRWSKDERSQQAMAALLGEGAWVVVEGSLSVRKWVDKTGQDRWETEIKVNKIMTPTGHVAAQSQHRAPVQNGGQYRARQAPAPSPKPTYMDPAVTAPFDEPQLGFEDTVPDDGIPF